MYDEEVVVLTAKEAHDIYTQNIDSQHQRILNDIYRRIRSQSRIGNSFFLYKEEMVGEALRRAVKTLEGQGYRVSDIDTNSPTHEPWGLIISWTNPK